MDDRSIFKARFANRYGEEWVFEYNARAGEGTLTGSDIDWQIHRVVDGKVPELVLNTEELDWLRRTWQEATGGRQ